MVQHGQKCTTMFQNGSNWSKIVQNGSYLVQNVPKLSKMFQNYIIWYNIVQFCSSKSSKWAWHHQVFWFSCACPPVPHCTTKYNVNYNGQNSAHKRHWISRRMQIVSPIPWNFSDILFLQSKKKLEGVIYFFCFLLRSKKNYWRGSTIFFLGGGVNIF